MTRQILLAAVLAVVSTGAAAQDRAADHQVYFAKVNGEGESFDVAFDAEDTTDAEDDQAAESGEDVGVPADIWTGNDLCCDVCCDPCYLSHGAVRLGWWSVGTRGSPTKIGEFQDLESSPFWDVDAVFSDGVETWDVIMSGLDNEANDAKVRYYSPKLSARVHFQRFLRRWDHEPLTGIDLADSEIPETDENVISEDLNVGEDYAIRVQELDSRFQGRLTDNLKWRLNVWALRKFGERQANATAHCFNVNAPDPAGATGNVCHVLSQRQTIDWLTVEVEGAVEAKFDNMTVEYSRTMRSFGESDGTVDRMYTRFGFSPGREELGPDFRYAATSENFTQIDRIRLNANLTHHNQFYANLYLGDTKNEFRDTHRQFGGYDFRLMNTSSDRLRLTAYATMHDENNQRPPFLLDEPPLAPAGIEDEETPPHPVDYNRIRTGVKATWRPFYDPCSCSPYGLWNGSSLVTGYEYYTLARDYAIYDTRGGTFVQPDTKRHQFEIGPSTRWSCSLDTFVRYRARFIEDPLFGVREASGDLNTNQPEQEHEVEFGGTWSPSANFMATARFSVLHRRHDSDFAYFTEEDYPVICTVWYAPTERLSLSGGYAYFSNFIDQDITLGANRPGRDAPTETTLWDYTGESHMFSLNARYAWSPCAQLVGGYIWNRGSNVFSVPPSPAGADWSLLPSLSDVIVETQRLTAGMDWQPYDRVTAYVRYIYFDYNDIAANLDSGTSHMGLAGAGVVY